ncbi:unnamed protein product [Nezara viridula]|uniref:H15 domain-containing protein n=1 Tax=Nezara viridula TaxID=85310 RepID=A0A9P0HSX0_NEZVI|nr:unnamed protein product [Nezara viridula]
MKDSKTKTKTSTHPPMKDMVINAISTLRERKGSSLYAIKKFISSNYKVDVNKLSHFIKKSLKSAVTSGEIIQTKGRGASGSFLMSKVFGKTKKPSATKAKKSKSSSEIKKKVVKKKSGEKKSSRTSMVMNATNRRKVECR